MSWWALGAGLLDVVLEEQEREILGVDKADHRVVVATGQLVHEGDGVVRPGVQADEVAGEVGDLLAHDLRGLAVVEGGEIEGRLPVVGVDDHAVAVDVRQTAHVAVTAVDPLVVGHIAPVVVLEPGRERGPVDHLHVRALVGRDDEPQQAEPRADDRLRVDVGETGGAVHHADPRVLLPAGVGEGGVERRDLLLLHLVHDPEERRAVRDVLVAGDGVHAVPALDRRDLGVLRGLDPRLDRAILADVLELHRDLLVVRQTREGVAGRIGVGDDRDELDLVRVAVERDVGDGGGAEEYDDGPEVSGRGGDDDELLVGLTHD